MYKYLRYASNFLVKAKCGHKLMSKSNENGIWQAAVRPPGHSRSRPSLESPTVSKLEPKSRHKFCAAKKNDRNAFIDQMRSSSSITRPRRSWRRPRGMPGVEQRDRVWGRGGTVLGAATVAALTIGTTFAHASLLPLPLELPFGKSRCGTHHCAHTRKCTHTCRIRNNVAYVWPFVVSVVAVALRRINK